MELEVDDFRGLGAIKRGADSVRFVKNIVNLKSKEIENILDILDNSGLIKSEYVSGWIGQKKLKIEITEEGKQKISNYTDSLDKQWKEMIEDPSQKIGRPRQLYTGYTSRPYVPREQR